MRTAGFVLVGGQSRRMGRDKGLLPWGSGALIEDVAARVASAAGNVTLVGNPKQYSRFPFNCLLDLRPGFGPLSGIETALRSGRGEYNLILACDMPDADSSHLRRLIEIACARPAKCVVTRDGTGKLHPLCAVYHDSCLATLTKAIEESRLRLMDLLTLLQAEEVRFEGTIQNVNTPGDWEALHSAHG